MKYDSRNVDVIMALEVKDSTYQNFIKKNKKPITKLDTLVAFSKRITMRIKKQKLSWQPWVMPY